VNIEYRAVLKCFKCQQHDNVAINSYMPCPTVFFCAVGVRVGISAGCGEVFLPFCANTWLCEI